MNFPYVHVAGDTLDFEVSVDDYPSTDGWTLKYVLVPRFSTPTQAPVTLTATGNADGTYQVQAAPSQTAQWKAGAYGWQRWVEQPGARQTLTGSHDQGEVEVRANPTDLVQGDDTRSHARKALAQHQEAILALKSGVKSYAIGSRTVTYRDMPELIEEESRLKWAVADEDARATIAATGNNPRRAGIRFWR